jgi:hypothetical protein
MKFVAALLKGLHQFFIITKHEAHHISQTNIGAKLAYMP